MKRVSPNPLLTCCIFSGGRATRLFPHTASPKNQKSMLVMGNNKQRLIDFSLRSSMKADHTYVITSSSPEKSEIVESYVVQWPDVFIIRDKREVEAGTLIDYYDTIKNEDPNGDIAILAPDHVHENFDLKKFHQHHLQTGRDVTLLVVSAKNYGSFVIDRNGLAEGVYSYYAPGMFSTCGTYIIKTRSLLEWIHSQSTNGWNGTLMSMYYDVICPIIEQRRASIFHLSEDGYWDDAGTLTRYYQNNMRLSNGKSVISEEALVPNSENITECVVIGNTVIPAHQKIHRAIVSTDNNGKIHVSQINNYKNKIED